MPFCPSCHYEYDDDVFTCPDCEVELVDELPEESDEPEYEDWTALARLNSEQEMEMVQEVMRNEGIPVVVQSGTGHFGVTGQMGMSSFRPIGGGYSLLVPYEFLERADRIGSGLLGEEWDKLRLIDLEEE